MSGLRGAYALGLGLSWLIVTFSGCAGHLGARKQLADAVQQVSEAARWGRSGAILGVVSPGYRARFVASRSMWGDDVQMADAEVMEVHLQDGQPTATAVVSYSWYQISTMSLHRTVVQQDWVWKHDTYRLRGEQVVSGDPELFAEPKENGEARESAGRARG